MSVLKKLFMKVDEHCEDRRVQLNRQSTDGDQGPVEYHFRICSAAQLINLIFYLSGEICSINCYCVLCNIKVKNL